MSRRDTYHDAARKALENDGWTITHDPLKLSRGVKDLYVDLGAERFFAAEKGTRKIAVEVKSFIGRSDVRDIEDALGQFLLYEILLAKGEPDRVIYLAVREDTYRDVFEEPVGRDVIESGRVRFVVFDESREVVTRWIP